MRYYFAPMEGLTDSIYRREHHRFFGGVDRYYMPFFSPPSTGHSLPGRPGSCRKRTAFPFAPSPRC